MADPLASLGTSPELFPLSLDLAGDQVRFLRLSEADYQKASFLDARLEAPLVGDFPYAAVAAAVAGAPIACDYIFHIGHVGSTLLSRLLGSHRGVFAVREPQVLRLFAQAEVAARPWAEAEMDARLRVFQALFSRVWRGEQKAMVKATSMVSGLAPRLMAQSAGAKALCMTAPLPSYLAIMLSGQNFSDVRQSAALRLARLARRLGMEPAAFGKLSPGEAIAMSWASDMAALREVEQRFPGQLMWLDFDDVLADRRASLSAILTWLNGGVEAGQVERIAASEHFGRYSKAPEYAYGPELRRQVLDESRRHNAAEIERGLAWFERLAPL